MSGDGPVVYVVDDDEAVRESISLLLESVGLACETFESAAAFLEGFDASRRCCLVCDIRMPGQSGLALQQELGSRGIAVPLIFITGHGDIPMAVSAMKAGATDFVQKPFRDQDLIDRINKALETDEAQHRSRIEANTIRERLDTLTPRETEVMKRVVSGQANKVIAMDLGVSQRTVELHRARVMHKLRMRSLADLVQAVSKAGLI